MMHPYGQFLVDFDRDHQDFTHRNLPVNEQAAVIVETRPLYFLPKVVRNVMYFLGPSWNLHFLGTPESVAHLQASLPGWRISTFNAATGPITTAEYNQVLLSERFWSALPESTLLIFQSDCVLTGHNVHQFTGFDFVGAPCRTWDDNYVANGGLSLRNRDTMLECLKRCPPQPGEVEDVFFSRAVRQLGGKMPDPVTAARFAVESVYVGHPVGVHGTDKFYHPIEVAQRIVRDTEA